MVFIAAASAIEAVHALTDYDLGDTDWESVKPFLSGDKRPTLVSALEKVPDEYHDTIYIGENDNEQTVQEFFD
ncbi:MAG: hypothetical protein EOO77_23935 [Oxalobacteraceae bacterium]|nr:MAG: hypothetical protein EOO77_23935 [Oxalobacteraceae bacterium]